MLTLNVDLGDRSYPIFIGSGVLDPERLRAFVRASQVLIVTNETIAPLYLDRVKALLTGLKVDVVVLPDGEKYKTLETVNTIFDQLLTGRHSRSTTLIALGGGVVGDMTGFASACYQRGTHFIQIPTTLLSQVDSSVGGKTGVNHPLGKNMIGAFHQPQAVFIDVDTLSTLPAHEFAAGLAEVIKYGLIDDLAFFEWLEANIERLIARETEVLIEAISRSCASKARIVAMDETESGVRALLNLGHTFGHAIEGFENYRGFLHGEAVAIGMRLAATFSAQQGWITDADVKRIANLLSRAGLPVVQPAAMTPADFIDFMQRDKKVQDGRMRLVLMKALGQSFLYDDATLAQIEAAVGATVAQ